ncbi:hypothetical protein Tco_1168424, partial [Tanacetum coccineum]
EEVSQEVAGDQVKDDAQEIVTDALATQKTEVPLQSSSIASDYATKFLNFDNIPSGETEIILMVDIKFQHEDPSIQTSPLLIVLVTSIELGKGSQMLKNVDHSSALLATIKSKVSTAVKEYLRTSLDDDLYKVHQRHTTDLNKEHSILADVVEKLKQKDKPQKSAKDIRKKRTLFETMTKTKQVKEKKPDDADRDEGPLARPDQGLKRKKTGKDSAQAEEIVFKAGDIQVPQNQRDDMGNTDEPPVLIVNPKDWFKKPERPPTLDPEWNECKIVNHKPTQKWLSVLTKTEKSSKTFDDLMNTPIEFSAFVMNRL